MCYNFGEISATDTVAALKEAIPHLSVLIISAQPRAFDLVSKLYAAGANAFLCSTTANQVALFNALDQAVEGNQYYTNSYKDKLIEKAVLTKALAPQSGSAQQEAQLSSREKQILQLIAKGQTSKEIARTLNISKYTVDVHRRNVMIKLNVRKATELTRFAIEHKLL